MRKQKKNYSRNKGKKPYFNKNKTISKNNNSSTHNKRSKNFRFIQRSKEAEELQRRHKIIEDKYKKHTLGPTEEDDDNQEDDEVEEENAFEALLSTLEKNGKKNKHIESSSDEDENASEEGEDEDEELEDEDLATSVEGADSIDKLDEAEGEEEDEIIDDSDLEEQTESDNDNSEIDQDDLEVEEEIDEGVEEEIEEEELDEELESIKLDQKASADPFSEHFDYELSPQHVENLLAKPSPVNKSELAWPALGRLQIEISQSGREKTIDPPQKKKKILLDEEHFASEGIEPQILFLNESNLEKYGIKQQLCKNISKANKLNIEPDSDELLTKLQIEILSIILNYQDLLLPQRTLENAEEIRFIYCLHSLNHMLKTRAKILHHNAKMKIAAENKKSTTIIPDAYQDQGLVRPKVLIVLPFRDGAFRVVNYFVDLLYGDKSEKAKTDGTVINYKRFMEEYTGDTLYFPKTNPKPEDYEKTFAGNTDDNFKIGISLTKKCIKLYTEFYSSDILIASPLGLRMVVGAAGDAERDYDFLTSIEVLVLDQAELFLAQNWEHLLHVLDHMHLQPQSTRNTDFSRVRPWCLNGLSRFYRQTLLCTSHELPEFRSLFSSKCSNYRGKVRVINPIVDGSIRNVFVQIPQVFHKLDVDSIENSFEKRFKYFINEILPQFKGPSMAHCMIYVPSYFDYVRLRNYFKTETVNFVQICEYTKDAKIARARDMFFHSAAHFLLYSERAHFFRRTRIKGIRHLIFYQPPSWPHLYPELINLMQESYQNPRDGLENSMSVTVLYSKYDMLQVSAIIGTERAGKLLRANKTTHAFMAGE